MRSTILCALFAALFAFPATAETYALGALRIEAAYARASIGSARTGVVYLTIRNQGDAPDTLVSAASPVARMAGLHTHVHEGGIMRMRPVKGGIALPPGATVMLKPGGYHVMLMGLVEPLKKGQRFPLTLGFAKAGTITVMVEVGGIAAGAPNDRGMGAMGGHGAPPGR